MIGNLVGDASSFDTGTINKNTIQAQASSDIKKFYSNWSKSSVIDDIVADLKIKSFSELKQKYVDNINSLYGGIIININKIPINLINGYLPRFYNINDIINEFYLLIKDSKKSEFIKLFDDVQEKYPYLVLNFISNKKVYFSRKSGSDRRIVNNSSIYYEESSAS